jgi:hypothetical protein
MNNRTDIKDHNPEIHQFFIGWNKVDPPYKKMKLERLRTDDTNKQN